MRSRSPAKKSFVTTGEQVIRIPLFYELAHLADPVEQNLAPARTHRAGLIGEFPGKHGGFFRVAASGEKVASGQKVVDPVFVSVSRAGGTIELGRIVVRQAKPVQVHGHAA